MIDSVDFWCLCSSLQTSDPTDGSKMQGEIEDKDGGQGRCIYQWYTVVCALVLS